MDITTRNHVTVLGSGERTMVLAHGFGCDQTMWRLMVEEFASDYRLVLFDYVGCGKSDLRAYDERRYGSLHGYTNDVLDVLEALGLEDVIFVGHSVSGMVGALASIQQPHRFSQLVMIAPSPRYLNDPPSYNGGFERDDVRSLLNMMEHNYTGWASYLAPVAMKHEEQPELAQELEAHFCAMDPHIARRFAEITFLSDTRSALPDVRTPTLVLQCTDDAIAPLEVGDYLAANLPRATLRVMDATGHCPHLSQPGETSRLIRDYLAASMPLAA